MSASTNGVDVRVRKALASCCGVNLAWAALGLFSFAGCEGVPDAKAAGADDRKPTLAAAAGVGHCGVNLAWAALGLFSFAGCEGVPDAKAAGADDRKPTLAAAAGVGHSLILVPIERQLVWVTRRLSRNVAVTVTDTHSYLKMKLRQSSLRFSAR
jgi:hypothetical protein